MSLACCNNSWEQLGRHKNQRFPVSLLRILTSPLVTLDAAAQPLPGLPQLLLPPPPSHSPFWYQSRASTLSQSVLPFAVLPSLSAPLAFAQFSAEILAC